MGQLRIALVAGEASGDILGAGLIKELKRRFPGLECLGVGGELMQAEGLVSLYPMDRLSVMGLLEPLKRLPELLRMRRDLIQQFKASRVDCFIGIDSPDFNLGIAAAMHKAGIRTAHYVSPSVWAWRQGRVKNIRRDLDLMLTLLPFEADFYRKHEVPVAFVGHPLASQIHFEPDKAAARAALGLNDSPRLLLLPGSRQSEVKHLMPLFVKVVERLGESMPGLEISVAAASELRAAQIREICGEVNLDVRVGHTQTLIKASDTVLAASGTTTLEIMLTGRPMVITYKADALSYGLISRMVKVPWVGLPNLIAAESLVPELIQDAATPEAIELEVLRSLRDETHVGKLLDQFEKLSDLLRLPSDAMAADAISNLLKDRVINAG